MTQSVHDNVVTGYAVDCESGSLQIRTELRDRGEPFERTDIRFEGVMGYLIRDSLGSVLFDIEESSVDEVLATYSGEFKWGERHGWPGSWNNSRGNARKHLADAGASAWFICSSIGFNGFVIGKSMSIEAVDSADRDSTSTG